ncbi:hypothetical protein [Vibrio sinensis]|uniref:hypothetical protein n=1 Tax=Vibrio sinensis TaxID=2302434 RepID=UPI001401EE5F|nr:hypothetical protein [Vibrio sinensis]
MLAGALYPIIVLIVMWAEVIFSLLTGETIVWYEWTIVAIFTVLSGGYLIYTLKRE